MARKRKTSTAEDLMDLIAMLPWWAGIALALASYMVLHSIAIRPLPAAQSPQQIGQLATTAIWQGLATGGQYILPLICLAGAAISAVRKRRRSQLFETTSASSSADALQNMSWREFETLVGEGFRRRGYGVKETGGGGPDGGVDLILSKNGEKTLVQCKQWKAFKVGVSTVRELYGGAAAGFVVTSGRFTQEAVAFAAGRNIPMPKPSEIAPYLWFSNQQQRRCQTALNVERQWSSVLQSGALPQGAFFGVHGLQRKFPGDAEYFLK